MKKSIKKFIDHISYQVEIGKVPSDEALKSLDQYREAIKLAFSLNEEYEAQFRMGISDIMNLHFKNIRDERVDEITRLNGNYSPLLHQIIEEEYDLIMDEDWSINDNNLLPSIFRNLSNDAKEIYAIITAEQYALKIISYSVSDFNKETDHEYSEYLFENYDWFK